ncbi:rhomboid family intramembrane serine protease [Halorhabdus amylolytica]|uniref:rhomboid family intramembrane serine protease n=1 Tax=Halorhabdus amylolytica TaxID=2559573 RepID=UPI0010A9CEC8|nr:rhomboid family intramembrane serine protease [Halorhabdus amylolytica]
MRRIAVGVWRLCGFVPITVAVVVGVSWYFVANGITDTALNVSLVTFLNPLWYLLSMVVHDGPAHFWGNMELFVPFAVVLTLLTSNRHVLGIVIVSHVLSNVVWVATVMGPAIGTSGATFGVVAATLVRATGYAFQNGSMESLQTMVAATLAPLLLGFFLVSILAGQSTIAHFAHFFAFLFGGGMEAMYVFAGHESDDDERSAPDRFVS